MLWRNAKAKDLLMLNDIIAWHSNAYMMYDHKIVRTPGHKNPDSRAFDGTVGV